MSRQPATDAIHARFDATFGAFRLDVDLRLPGRGVTALFGHSGAGKSTLLRCIAGLVRAPGGQLVVGGEAWQDGARFVPPHRRPIGYVFQEASLFPHLTVRGNIEFGMKRVPAHERRVSLDAVVALLGIEPLLARRPEGLSGGERQRVAIARALAVSPRWLLLDEPLAALDHARKQELLPYLERLRDDLDIPVLFVSHVPDEIARLADHLVVLRDGRALAEGPLRTTLARLDLAGVFADDLGTVLDAVVLRHDDAEHLTELAVGAHSLVVGRRDEPVGRRIRVRVQASDVSIALQQPDGTSILNILPATVVELAEGPAAGHVLVRLAIDDATIVARISTRSRRLLSLAPGMRAWAQIKSVALPR